MGDLIIAYYLVSFLILGVLHFFVCIWILFLLMED